MYKKSANEIPPDEALVEDSTFTRTHLKTKILKYDLLPYKCAICGLYPEWNGQILTLQVDHINGNNKDHRLENLRFLCPNCHSQTPNYAGANALNRKPGETFTCTQCGKYRSRVSQSGLCVICISTRDKIKWPDDEILKEMVNKSNINQVAKQLGVSYPGLKKRLKKIS
jgi:Zn finger protein HypA/HybF involved in hydrogenase expression